jgi:O-antigen biosynthesis protein
MQQLQEPVLNKIQPGINPIFIISPNTIDGEPLAMLLSEHLIINDKYDKNGKERLSLNYFHTEETHKLLPPNSEIKKDKIEEYRSSLKFIIEKGFDNSKLWGLQLDYKLFFDLRVDEVFPNAFFIFLYGTRIKKYNLHDLNENSYKRLLDFYHSHSQNSILLHVNNAIYTPSLLLKYLPLSPGVRARELAKKLDTHIDHKNSNLYYFDDIESDIEIKRDLDNNNLIAINDAWFQGNEVLHLLLLDEFANHEIILKKIHQFYNSFLSSPDFYIICKNENEKLLIQKLLINVKKIVKNIEIIVCHQNIAIVLNEIISVNTSKYIVIDNLNLSFSPLNALYPFKKPQYPTFTFGNLPSNNVNEDKSTKVRLVDMLTIRSVPETITFSKELWEHLSGFDANLDHKSTIWDFAIRSLQGTGNFALETEAAVANPETLQNAIEGKYESVEKSMIPYEAYRMIIDKHRSVFEENLNRIIKISSENQHIPQHEIIKLNYSVSKLSSLLSHSRHELKSANELKVQLQSHINLLESRWHFKLVHKLVHLKNIFFKESTGGKNGILNVLKFFIFAFTRPGFRIIRKLVKGGFRKLYLLLEDRPVKIVYLDNGSGNSETPDNYNDWIRAKLEMSELKSRYNKIKQTFTIKPKISVIMPVYNPDVNYLDEAIKSVIDQLYDNWELCIADDCSPNPQIKRLLNSYSLKDSRIKVIFRKENGHISACSNSALTLATGDYIMLLDHDDLLTPNCMAEVVNYINLHPDVQFIYSDEDKVDDNKIYSNPFFKPDWSPDRFLALNYVAHVVVIDKQLMDKVNGFRLGLEGSQDYDLILRITEQTDKIGHIPEILYHWRIHLKSVASAEGDAKPYAYIAAKKALEEAMVRRQISAEVHYMVYRGCYRIKYNVNSYEKVSIIIPTKDQTQMMKNTIDSIFSLTSYPNYEVIVLNNNSVTKEFFDLMSGYTEQYGDKFRCIEASFPFNFSKLMNVGAAASTGEYILMLNNDVEIIQDDWITRMVSFAQQKRIGAVGVRLLYPNDNIQHAGTIIGLGAAAGHIYVGAYKDNEGYFNCLKLTTNYSAVTAACLMIRKDVYEEVNGMEEKLEIEYNDVDFCLRIMERGYYNIYVPDVTLYHYESATRGHPHQNKVSYQRHLREVKYFQDTWGKYIKHDPFYNHHLSYERADAYINYNS